MGLQSRAGWASQIGIAVVKQLLGICVCCGSSATSGIATLEIDSASMACREAAHAGSWYNDDGRERRKEVTLCFFVFW